ncbi:DUF736 family protein [Pseudomonas aeruginosa]|nr:DUF736 family protein [Pseudomonas aeruginosa]MDY1220697.1 DUF736 family protein [Pseudomonas aeruginosa]
MAFGAVTVSHQATSYNTGPTLDDPSHPATVYARLIEGEGGTHDLIWSRSKPHAA